MSYSSHFSVALVACDCRANVRLLILRTPPPFSFEAVKDRLNIFRRSVMATVIFSLSKRVMAPEAWCKECVVGWLSKARMHVEETYNLDLKCEGAL